MGREIDDGLMRDENILGFVYCRVGCIWRLGMSVFVLAVEIPGWGHVSVFSNAVFGH